jgi:hypothetical protein
MTASEMIRVGEAVKVLKGTRKGTIATVTDVYMSVNGKTQVILDIPNTAPGHRRFIIGNVEKV